MNRIGTSWRAAIVVGVSMCWSLSVAGAPPAKPSAAKPAANKPAPRPAAVAAPAPASPRADPTTEGGEEETDTPTEPAGDPAENKEALEHAEGRRDWRPNDEMQTLAESEEPEKKPWTRLFTDADFSLAVARSIAAKAKDPSLSVDALARALYVLEVESPAEGKAFAARLGQRVVERGGDGEGDGTKQNTTPRILEQAQFFHSQFDVPCSGPVRRMSPAWPPQYECSDRDAKKPTYGPVPIVRLQRRPVVTSISGPMDPKKRKKRKGDRRLAQKRIEQITQRDGFALPQEALAGGAPSQFCVGERCFNSYAQVASALYGAGAGRKGAAPVFCAPRAKGVDKNGVTSWSAQRVQCSSQWFDTLGGWSPWNKEGEPAAAAKAGALPPYACFGAPHLLSAHMILPPGGKTASGFYCRKRVFRVLAVKAEASQKDRNQNIARVCSEMRQQVWGEKYPSINAEYQKWCNGPKGPRDKSLCIPLNQKPLGSPGAAALPFMTLSREELLYFYGNQELYCRADRAGLTHFLYNDAWAETFTCGVPRGVLEAGPFEEGVQSCAIAPFSGKETGEGKKVGEHQRARLHCWRFNRPTCEAVSKDPTQDDIHKSAVFDALDALREYRRTRHDEVWSFYDMRDSEKLEDWEDKISYADTAKDEGTMGVREFCRFVGAQRALQCGYDKRTIARHYELRKNETPAGCNSGVCLRGAYERGYLCGLFSSPELFEGQPRWICGVDRGPAGRAILRSSTAVCLGGKATSKFQSAKGDRSSLQCYERRFYWGESAASERILRKLSWHDLVKKAGSAKPRLDAWLYGGQQASRWIAKANLPKEVREILDEASGKVSEAAGKIDKDIKKATRKGDKKKARNLRKEKAKKAREIRKDANKKIRGDKKLRKKLKWFRDEKRRRRAMLKRGQKKARAHFDKQAAKDAKDLTRWAKKYGHTMGHRTSMRVALLASNVGVIKKFRELKFEKKQDFSFVALGDKCGSGGRCAKYNFLRDSDDDDKGKDKGKKKGKKGRKGKRKKEKKKNREWAISKDKAKELNELLDEVRNEGRPADGRWYQSFRLAATEDGQLRVDPAALSIVRRVNRLFDVLAAARAALLKQAKAYADAVYQKARGSKELLSRVELHERARGSAVADRYKGGVYCVTDRKSRSAESLRQFVCATSPLLVAGSVERKVGRRNERRRARRDERRVVAGGKKKGAAADRGRRRNARKKELEERRRTQIRAKVSFEWCFGGIAGRRVVPRGATRVLYDRTLSSPFVLDVPETVVKPGAKEAHAARSASDWMKCSGFQYSDEGWEHADPPKKQKKDKVAKRKGGKSGDPRAAEQTAKIMNKVGGILSPMIRLVLPKFADAFDRVRDMANVAGEFLDKWRGIIVDLAKKQWQSNAANIDKAQEQLKEAEAAMDQARDALHKAEVDVAGAGPQKKQAEEKKVAAQEVFNAAKKTVKEKKTELAATKKAAQKDKTMKGSGNVMGQMLEELVTVVTSRISAVIEPNARQLLSRGFKFVRQILDPIAKSVISSLAGIPFVGAGLAALGQVAYSLGLDALENLAFDALFGLVERILAKGVRAIITPVFKAVQGKLLELALAACTTLFPDVCPRDGGLKFSALPEKDRWIERALACEPKPVFDDAVYRDAALARREIMGIASEMRRDVAVYARDLADRYLAQYGLSYDAWMAAVGNGAPSLTARAEGIDGQLRERAQRLQAERDARGE